MLTIRTTVGSYLLDFLVYVRSGPDLTELCPRRRRPVTTQGQTGTRGIADRQEPRAGQQAALSVAGAGRGGAGVPHQRDVATDGRLVLPPGAAHRVAGYTGRPGAHTAAVLRAARRGHRRGGRPRSRTALAD